MLPDLQNNLLNFLKVESFTGNEYRAGIYLVDMIKRFFPDFSLSLQEIDKNRFNVIGKLGNPKVIFSSHFDTVPGGPEVRVESDLIYGRGSCDAKGQIITQLSAIYDLSRAGAKDLGFVYVIGEEVDGIGSQHYMDNNPINAKYLINGEPTECQFVSSSKGVIEVLFEIQAESRHSCTRINHSAIHQMIGQLNHLLVAVEKNSDFYINVGKIEGGLAPNVQSPNCKAWLCIRTKIAPEQVIQQIEDILNQSGLVVVSQSIPPLNFSVPKGYIGTDVDFCSDCFAFSKLYTVIMIGPGTINDAHTENEHVRLSEIFDCANKLQLAFEYYDSLSNIS